MPSTLEIYGLFVGLTFFSLFVAAVYAQAKSNGDFATVWNTPVGWVLGAGLIGCYVVGIISLYGGDSFAFGTQSEKNTFLIYNTPLIAGCVALAVAAGHSRLSLLFRRSRSTETATVSNVGSGDTVIVTGKVTATTDTTSPGLDQPAVCWVWRFATRDEATEAYTGRMSTVEKQLQKAAGGRNRDLSWDPRKGDSGGVPFELDDGSGTVRINPTEASVKLPLTTEQVYHAESPQPGRVGNNLHRSVSAEEYKYREGIATDGDELTILGTVTDDGDLIAHRIYDSNRAAAADQRYAVRAVVAAVVGVVAVAGGVMISARHFGTPLPF